MLHLAAGLAPYPAGSAWQDELHARRVADEIDDVLLTLEHEPVYTAGRHADLERNLTGLRADIPVVDVDRGGDVTYHGPGQLVAYPIVRLDDPRDVRGYVAALEAACAVVAASFGVEARTRPEYPGLWVGQEKLAAIGVRVHRGVTKHGLALNVAPDLDHFDGIVPCGIRDGGVCSLRSLGADAPLEEVRERLVDALARALRRDARTVADDDQAPDLYPRGSAADVEPRRRRQVTAT